jgi:hypothetical protein
MEDLLRNPWMSSFSMGRKRVGVNCVWFSFRKSARSRGRIRALGGDPVDYGLRDDVGVYYPVMLTENSTAGVVAAMTLSADRPLLIKPKPASDMIAATTNMANFVLIFMISSSFCFFLFVLFPLV